MSLTKLVEAVKETPELKRFIYRLLEAAERDPCFAACDLCRVPFFTDTDEDVSTCEIVGCWFAATGREKYRAAWCEPRAAILRALEQEGRDGCELGYRCPEGPHGVCCGEYREARDD